MKTPAVLAKWFPEARFEVTEEFNRQSAREIFTNKGAAGWGAGKIGQTGYTKLYKDEKSGQQGKCFVIVCKNELLGDLLTP